METGVVGVSLTSAEGTGIVERLALGDALMEARGVGVGVSAGTLTSSPLETTGVTVGLTVGLGVGETVLLQLKSTAVL